MIPFEWVVNPTLSGLVDPFWVVFPGERHAKPWAEVCERLRRDENTYNHALQTKEMRDKCLSVSGHCD